MRITKEDAYNMTIDYIEFAPVDIKEERKDYNFMAKNIIEVYYLEPTDEEIEMIVDELNREFGWE